MANRLAHETSPYLLQHAENPVDWFPWGEEALVVARERDRPLLVSIGYSACHWCHVMERESFEDPEVAAVMNDRFVCVKVDREERPDIDAICMEACQTMTGQGGWPLNTFLTPEQVPFFAGTYFPPSPRPGMASWRMVLDAIDDAWRNRREEIVGQTQAVIRALGATARIEPSQELPGPDELDSAASKLLNGFDRKGGGWGRAPKFPQASAIEFLLARGERAIPLASLRAMAAGGMFDQVGGGFARYSVDATWTVPHFEKMLYDNALLARAYLHGWQVSGEERLGAVCRETLDWALREMRGPEGGFCSALDADSEGVEGKFYVWTIGELAEVLGPLADDAIAYFGASEAGNFEHGLNVLEAHGPVPDELDEIRRRLFEARRTRVRPGLDDKRITSWNALMISALAEAGAVLERDDYLGAARGCAEFLLGELRDSGGRLLRTWKGGRGRLLAYLEDHAYLLDALLVLYESSFEQRWYAEAVALADAMLDRFADAERGGFFTTGADHEALVTRRKDLDDTPIPSGNSAAALALLRLYRLSGDARFEAAALGVLRLLGGIAVEHPLAFANLLRALDFDSASVVEVAIVSGNGADAGREALVRAVRERFRPHIVLAGTAVSPPSSNSPVDSLEVPLLTGRGPVDGQAAAYICEHFVCRAPVTDVPSLEDSLSRRS
jgi:uncharacterized protein YyaL (SSP411 family)